MDHISSLFEIQKPKDKSRNEIESILNDFLCELNKERGKRKPLKFMAIKMKLILISKDKDALLEFFSKCKDYKNRNGSFSKYFWGVLKIK